jgi:predicted nucleic acid-binding protein
VIAVDTSVIVRYLVGTPVDQARRAAKLIDAADTDIGIPIVALAEAAHVLRTQYGIAQADIIDSLIALIQRENVRTLGLRSEVLVSMLVRARSMPGRPIPDAMIVAEAAAAETTHLATFDRGQERYGIPILRP